MPFGKTSKTTLKILMVFAVFQEWSNKKKFQYFILQWFIFLLCLISDQLTVCRRTLLLFIFFYLGLAADLYSVQALWSRSTVKTINKPVSANTPQHRSHCWYIVNDWNWLMPSLILHTPPPHYPHRLSQWGFDEVAVMLGWFTFAYSGIMVKWMVWQNEAQINWLE